MLAKPLCAQRDLCAAESHGEIGRKLPPADFWRGRPDVGLGITFPPRIEYRADAGRALEPTEKLLRFVHYRAIVAIS